MNTPNPEERNEPTREELDHQSGPALVEFGASWCTHCQALRPDVDSMMHEFRQVRLVRVEDGKGRRLGRSFGVTLWPTLVYMRDGKVLEQLVRPTAAEAREAMQRLASQGSA